MAGSAQTVVHGNLKEQAAQKEKEWRELQELQIQTLEAALKDCRKELIEEKAKMGELKEHFKYNLRLIGDRDAELQRYDALFFELKSVVLKKEQEISDLKVKIDELKISAGRDSKAREEMQLHYQQRIREKQAEMEQSRSDKDAEINAERESLEVHKKLLDRRVIELEQELDRQQREMAIGFDEAMRKRDHEYRVEMDKMSSTVLAHELKVKMLVKEIEMMKAAQESNTREIAQSDNMQRDLEKQFKQKEWELEDVKAMNNARIAELEGKLHQCELVAKRQRDDFERRFAETDRLAKEKDAALVKLRDSASEREHHLQSEIQTMSSKLEDSSVRLRQLEWNVQDLEKEKSNAVEKLEEELADVNLRWESNVAEMSRDNVARDLELNALRDTQSKIRVELEQRKLDNERYKRDLAAAVERQASLEQSRAQLELDWQRRYEDIERLQYSHSEDLVRTLTKARDEALAEVRVKDNVIEDKENLIKLLTSERDQALVTLNKHGLMADRNIKVTPVDQSDTVSSLQRQNEELRLVIKQMRLEMESLGDRLPTVDVQQDGNDTLTHSDGTVMKGHEDSHQQSRTQVTANKSFVGRALSDNDRDLAKDSILISTHVQQLNNTIGSMRSERTELMAQLRKQQLRIVHLENMNDQLSKQPREKQVEIDQLQYELNASKRRTDAELASLRQRTSDLELQVTEARKEADEYYRASIERNTEATALANQLSQMKLELAKSNPTINFGAQELMIQQLQDELRRVRRHHGNSVLNDPSDSALISEDVNQLREQLHKAVRRVTQLTKDKEVLIELGNRLRAQLIHHGVKLPSPPSNRRRIIENPVRVDLSSEPAAKDQPVSQQRTLIQQNYRNKLKELEQLQYDLTKQELAQQHKKSQRRDSVGSTDDSRLPRSSDSEADQPRSILKSKSSVGANNRDPNRGQPSKSAARDVGTSDEVAPVRLQSSVSSTGGAESLQEIWAMMDADGGPSPQHTSRTPRYTAANSLRSTAQTATLPTPRPTPRPQSTDSWTVQGSRPNIQSKITHKKNTSPGTGIRVPAATTKKSRVRNYNMKDDVQSAR